MQTVLGAGYVHNPADIQSKIWGYQQIWTMLKSILFWEGDTDEIEG